MNRHDTSKESQTNFIQTNKESQSVVNRWTVLSTAFAGQCCREHEDFIIKFKNHIELNLSPHSNSGNNGKLKGMLELAEHRLSEITHFVDYHRRMYGTYDSDKINMFEDVGMHLQAAINRANGVDDSSQFSPRRKSENARLKELTRQFSPQKAKNIVDDFAARQDDLSSEAGHNNPNERKQRLGVLFNNSGTQCAEEDGGIKGLTTDEYKDRMKLADALGQSPEKKNKKADEFEEGGSKKKNFGFNIYNGKSHPSAKKPVKEIKNMPTVTTPRENSNSNSPPRGVIKNIQVPTPITTARRQANELQRKEQQTDVVIQELNDRIQILEEQCTASTSLQTEQLDTIRVLQTNNEEARQALAVAESSLKQRTGELQATKGHLEDEQKKSAELQSDLQQALNHQWIIGFLGLLFGVIFYAVLFPPVLQFVNDQFFTDSAAAAESMRFDPLKKKE